MRGQIDRNLPTDMGTYINDVRFLWSFLTPPPLKSDIIMFKKMAFLSEIKKKLPMSFMDGPYLMINFRRIQK